MITVTPPQTGQSAHCEPILRALPQWFGIEEATRWYVEQTDRLPTLVAYEDEQPVGFLSLQQHSPAAAEIIVMAVHPDKHRQGIGHAMTQAAEGWLVGQGIRFLQVKTLSEKHPDEGYARTRQFYLAMGFVVLEEFLELWGKENPAVQLIKVL